MGGSTPPPTTSGAKTVLRAEEIAKAKERRAEQFREEAKTASAREAHRALDRARTLDVRAEQARRNVYALKQAGLPSGCGPNSFRCPQARNMRIETPECCKRWIREILAGMAGLLDDLDCTWWVDYGTLLGAVREGGLISFDKDSDLGMMADDREKLLGAFGRIKDELGYWPTYAKGAHGKRFRTGDRVKVRLSQRNKTNTDIFIWNRRPGGMLDRAHYIGADVFKGREFPEAWLYAPGTDLSEPERPLLPRADFDGISVAIPAQARKLVAYRYGPDWETPQRAKHPPGPRGSFEEWLEAGGER